MQAVVAAEWLSHLWFIDYNCLKQRWRLGLGWIMQWGD